MNRTVTALALCAALLLLAAGGYLFFGPAAHGPSPVGQSQFSHDNDDHARNSRFTTPRPASTVPESSTAPAGTGDTQPEAKAAKSDGQENKSSNLEKVDLQKITDEHNRRTRTIREDPVQPKKVLTIIISGTVVDERAASVQGADILQEFCVKQRVGGMVISLPAPPEIAATTDATGSFSFRLDREVDSYAVVTIHLAARAPGFAESDALKLDVSTGGSYPGVALKLKSAGGVTGHVIDQSGSPLAKVRVVIGTAAMPGERATSSGLYRQVLTDSTGAFTISEMAAGSYPIGVLSPAHEYKSGPKIVNIVGGQLAPMEADIVVEVVISLRLQVVDLEGAPIVGGVTIEFRDGDKMVQRLSARSAPDGTVILAHPPVGSHEVFVHVDGYIAPPSTRHSFAAQKTTDLGTLTLTPQPEESR